MYFAVTNTNTWTDNIHCNYPFHFFEIHLTHSIENMCVSTMLRLELKKFWNFAKETYVPMKLAIQIHKWHASKLQIKKKIK